MKLVTEHENTTIKILYSYCTHKLINLNKYIKMNYEFKKDMLKGILWSF